MPHERVYKVRLPQGTVFGPANLATLTGWARENRIPKDAMLVECDEQGVELGGETGVKRVIDLAPLAAILNAPPTIPMQMVAAPQSDDAVSVIIPYKNPRALWGYYASVGNLLMMFVPLLGVISSGVIIYVGASAIGYARKHEKAHGRAHAVVAIVLGSLGLLVGLAITASVVVALVGK